MGFNQLAGRSVSIVGALELGWWDVAEGGVEALGVEPVNPLQSRQFHVVDGSPWSSPADQLGLVEPVDRLRERVDAPICQDCAVRGSGSVE